MSWTKLETNQLERWHLEAHNRYFHIHNYHETYLRDPSSYIRWSISVQLPKYVYNPSNPKNKPPKQKVILIEERCTLRILSYNLFYFPRP